MNTGIVWKDYSVSLKKIHKHNQEIIYNIIFFKKLKNCIYFLITSVTDKMFNFWVCFPPHPSQGGDRTTEPASTLSNLTTAFNNYIYIF